MPPAEVTSPLSSLLLTVLPWILVVSSTSLSLPQIWLSCFRGRTSGLDLTASLLAPTISLGWLIFGLLLQDGLQILVNSVTAACNLAILAALMVRRPDARSGTSLLRALPLSTLLAAGVLAVITCWFTGMLSQNAAASAVGTVTVVFTFIAVVPQPVALLRDRRQDVSGVSVGRFALSAVSALLWSLYGVLTGSPIVVTSAVLGAASAGVVVYCVLTAGRQSAPTTVTRRELIGATA